MTQRELVMVWREFPLDEALYIFLSLSLHNESVKSSMCSIKYERNPNGTLLILTRPGLVSKIFQDFSSHRIFEHMHGALNIDKNKN